MKKLISTSFNKFKQHEFSKSVATLATGTIISQIIPILFSPIISRIYSPQDYALVAAYSSITVILTIIATGMYDSALMIDKEDSEAINTGSFAILITFLVTIISAIFFLLYGRSVTRWIGSDDLGFWIFLAPITILFHGFYQTLNVWNNRKGRYKRMASNRIIMTLITTSATLYFGYLGFAGKGLILSLIIGQAISFILLLIQTIRNDKEMFHFISWPLIWRSAKMHKHFPIYNMPQGFLDGLRESGLIWVISFFFGATALGYFSFAKNILMRPLQVIGNSVGNVFFQKASKVYHETNDIYKISKKTVIGLFLIGFPFAIVIFLWGESIFTIIWGQTWVEAGKFSKILIFWLLLNFIASPLGFVPIILKKQRQFFIFSVLTAAVPTGLFYFLGKTGYNIETSMIMYALTNIFFIIVFIKWIDLIIKKVCVPLPISS